MHKERLSLPGKRKNTRFFRAVPAFSSQPSAISWSINVCQSEKAADRNRKSKP